MINRWSGVKNTALCSRTLEFNSLEDEYSVLGLGIRCFKQVPKLPKALSKGKYNGSLCRYIRYRQYSIFENRKFGNSICDIRVC